MNSLSKFFVMILMNVIIKLFDIEENQNNIESKYIVSNRYEVKEINGQEKLEIFFNLKKKSNN